jgi:FdhD protein
LTENWHSSRIEEPKTTWKDEHLDPNPTFCNRKCIEISGTKRREMDVDVAVERVVNIVLNGGCVTALAALPIQLKEMAIGFLIGEGMVKSFNDISSVALEKDATAAPWMGHQCCSVGGADTKNLKQIDSDLLIKSGALLDAVEQLNDYAKLWRRTGATHTSIICDIEGKVLASCEDVSRSSSVDKTVGAALMAGFDFSKCALITSGRLSGVMVAKAARAGFPILVSRSAPMNSGVELAEKIGMTLVGFVRKPNLYVYTRADRIV